MLEDTGGSSVRKISLAVLLAAAMLITGCYTRAYREAVEAQQAQSLQRNTSPVMGHTK